MKQVIFTALISLCVFNLFAQPGTEIYLFDLKQKKGSLHLSNPVNITNRVGYDNQPFFHPEKSLLYFVSADTAGRTDIFCYDYAKKQTEQITRTPEREYSPTVTPDKLYLSCIIQRDNGAQDLGKYPVGGGDPTILINNLTVGYHAWANQDQLLVFTLPQPFKLHLIDVSQQLDTVIAERIGRSLHKVPGKSALSFIQKVNDTDYVINTFEPKTNRITTVAKSLPGREKDMTWLPDGKILMSDEKKIYFNSLKPNSDWTEVQIDGFTTNGIITRMAVNAKGDKIAVVISE